MSRNAETYSLIISRHKYVCICLSYFWVLLHPFPQISHLKGISDWSVCTDPIWSLRFDTSLPHIGQASFSLWVLLMSCLTIIGLLNTLPQISHSDVTLSCWIFTWVQRLAALLKDFPQGTSIPNRYFYLLDESMSNKIFEHNPITEAKVFAHYQTYHKRIFI